jgi:hypothetical protein
MRKVTGSSSPRRSLVSSNTFPILRLLKTSYLGNDDGWTTVPTRTRTQSGTRKAEESESEPTKKQRQNAAKREAEKAAKAEAEADRQARLSRHRLDRLREQMI